MSKPYWFITGVSTAASSHAVSDCEPRRTNVKGIRRDGDHDASRKRLPKRTWAARRDRVDQKNNLLDNPKLKINVDSNDKTLPDFKINYSPGTAVNLITLPTKLIKTCFSRLGSLSIHWKIRERPTQAMRGRNLGRDISVASAPMVRAASASLCSPRLPFKRPLDAGVHA